MEDRITEEDDGVTPSLKEGQQRDQAREPAASSPILSSEDPQLPELERKEAGVPSRPLLVGFITVPSLPDLYVGL